MIPVSPVIALIFVVFITQPTSGESFSCYDCSAHNPNCGTDQAVVAQGCQACLVFQNIYDNNIVHRRCCTSNCGAPGTIGNYEGRTAYFCESDLCNGIGAENELTTVGASSTDIFSSTSPAAQSSTTATTAASITQQASSQCYDCSGPECGKEGSSVSNGCPSCTVYRNPDNKTKIERHCCWWACGAHNTVGMYNGIETYFCTGDKCNGEGTESALSPLAMTTTTVTTTTGTESSTVTTASTTQQTSSQCYDCSGPDCGKEGSSVSSNCPSCMVYRNSNDQTKIERHCCWWACGAHNTVGMYNGIETYFCTGDKCNQYGVESALTPPVTTMTTTDITMTTTDVTMITTDITMTTTTTGATTSSLGSCSLNCQNGGTPETENGCFCYCLDNTSGRECENIDCTQPDIDPEVCSSDNESLCIESENFAFECRHLCGKC